MASRATEETLQDRLQALTRRALGSARRRSLAGISRRLLALAAVAESQGDGKDLSCPERDFLSDEIGAAAGDIGRIVGHPGDD